MPPIYAVKTIKRCIIQIKQKKNDCDDDTCHTNNLHALTAFISLKWLANAVCCSQQMHNYLNIPCLHAMFSPFFDSFFSFQLTFQVLDFILVFWLVDSRQCVDTSWNKLQQQKTWSITYDNVFACSNFDISISVSTEIH